MTREELIKKIALKMDEISSSDDVIVPVGTGDNNPLYTQINNLINESVNDVLMKAPVYRLGKHTKNTNGSLSAEKISGTDRKVATITVPDSFIRIVQINASKFQRPIIDLAIAGDDVAKKQHNRHVMAKYARPVAVLERTDSGMVITCYSFDENDTGAPTMYYIERYDNEMGDPSAETGLDDYLTDIVSWVCAGKVFAAQGNADKGQICDNNAVSLMI